jgi:membrane protease YdiL (CAAX protease family)
MFLKAAFKNAPLYAQLIMLLAVIAFCTFFTIFVSSFLIIFKVGISPEAIKEAQQNIFDNPELLRGMQFLQTIGVFLLPAVLCAWLFSDDYKEYLQIDKPIYIPVAVWTVISIVVAIPFLNWTYFLNQQMVFPESLKGLENLMKESEAAAKRVIELILDTKDIPVIVFNFLLICVVAGICEEFMFRGFLQTFFGKIIRNPHVLVWTVAILFSAIHFQFYGFITRMLLGAWLGYLMYYTKTIWIPALAHFTNNFFSIGAYYIFHNNPDKMQEIDTIGTGSTWWLSIASLALFFFCFMRIKKAVNT